MYENLISIFALIFSVVAIIFTVIGTGLGFTLGFRERAETSRRKAEIKAQLEQNLNEGIHAFFEKSKEKDSSYEKLTEDIMSLASMVESVDLADDLLENMTRYGHQFLRMSMFTIVYAIVVTLYLSTMLSGFEDVLVLAIGSFLVGAVVLIGYLAYSNLKRYYYIREDFLRLHEDATMETCNRIREDLDSKGVRLVY